MQKVTIYRFSKNPRYENTYDNNSWFKVNEQLDDDECAADDITEYTRETQNML